MRKPVWCLLLTCAAALAQSSPDNAAAEALKKRLEGLNLLNAPTVQQPIRLSGPVAPQVCSIPLLAVRPPGTQDKMPTVQPPQTSVRNNADYVRVPAPPCGAGVFTNQK